MLVGNKALPICFLLHTDTADQAKRMTQDAPRQTPAESAHIELDVIYPVFERDSSKFADRGNIERCRGVWVPGIEEKMFD